MPKIIKTDEARGTTQQCGCCEPERPLQPLPLAMAQPQSSDLADDAPCCGAKQGPPSSPFAKPGYKILSFVDGFVETPVGPAPRVYSKLNKSDYLGTIRARLGFSRDQYLVAPGLYCVGNPNRDSKVLVTANYKLSFDELRENLYEVDVWILVIDTRGVNVWCAAGKKTFSSQEIIRMVKLVGLADVVNHRTLLLPQLGAPGVAAHLVRKGCGFKVNWGPIRASDLKRFISDGNSADRQMRLVSFNFTERLVLVPVELSLIVRPSLWLIALFFVLSGISPQLFSLSQAWERGIAVLAAYGTGVFAGAVVVPLLLPWLPSRSFYLKGIFAGLLLGGLNSWLWRHTSTDLEFISMLLTSLAISSFAAMNFTGATPYTSPSGVEKEMRRGIPLQGVMALVAMICLVWAGVSL